MTITEMVVFVYNHTGVFTKVIITTLATIFGGGLFVAYEQKKSEERNSLDFLLVSISRYLHYIIGLINNLKQRQIYLQKYISDPNDKAMFEQAFCVMSVIPNFEININKYNFTINTRPCIVDDILLYQQLYKEVEEGFSLLNEISRNADFDNQQESLILAKNLLSKNWHIYILLVVLSKSAYLLNRVLKKVNEYKILYRYRFKDSLGMMLSDSTQREMLKIVEFLESLDDKSWKECINDLEPKNFRYCVKKFIQRIFSVTNEGNHKKICFLGFKIKFRRIRQKKADAINDIHTILQEHSNNFKQIQRNFVDLTMAIGVIYEEITKKKKE